MSEAIIVSAMKKLGEFITGKLCPLVGSKLDVLMEVKENAYLLAGDLNLMLSFFKENDEYQGGRPVPIKLISDIDNFSQDTNLALDQFTDMSKNNDLGCNVMTILWEIVQYAASICNSQHTMVDIGMEILELRKRAEEIKRRIEVYESKNRASGGGGGEQSGTMPGKFREFRRTTSFSDEKLFVGFEDVKRKLLDELLKDEPYRCVVSIHGMGGLGKTTLARSLYNSPELISRFPKRAWVCVTQNDYTILGLLRSVFKSFKKRCSPGERLMLERMNVEDLERELRKLLMSERYLVVVDDVWDKEPWESLKRAFPDCENGSRVIVTTRKRGVATQIDERVYAHHLRFLNQTESWKLFLGKIGQEHENWCYPTMKDLGREMVKKCGGLPLTIVVLGGLLFYKETPEEWQQVKEHIWRDLEEGSDKDKINNLLSLSYNDLPRRLKNCFLYLGTFPEDDLIDATHLKYLWMGEQFIPPGEDMEDDAERCLNELKNRSLIQTATTRCWVEIEECRIHDLVRDLAIRKASEEDFFHIYNPNTNHSHPFHKKRHVVHAQIQRYFSVNQYKKRLQSLVVRNLDEKQHEAPQSFDIFAKFNNLCSLKLDGKLELDELPNIFGNLLQLKYLGLFWVCVVSLPPSIGKLKRLQTLEGQTGRMCELPPEASQLESLRHLICLISGNADIGCLSSLRTLRGPQYEHWHAVDKENLVNLRELWIKCNRPENGKPYILGPFTNFNKLHTLVLLCDYKGVLPPLDFLGTCQNIRELWLDGKIEMLPPVEKWPASITNLGLIDSNLEEDPIPTLGRLPNLRCLDLRKSHKSTTMVFGPNDFSQLQTLDLHFPDNLETLELGKGAMPKIRQLHVYHCDKLVHIPDRLRSILKLTA